MFTTLHAVLHTAQQVLSLSLSLSTQPDHWRFDMSTHYEFALEYACSHVGQTARALAKLPPRQDRSYP
jgi:hypothetical protein